MVRKLDILSHVNKERLFSEYFHENSLSRFDCRFVLIHRKVNGSSGWLGCIFNHFQPPSNLFTTLSASLRTFSSG